MIDLDWLQDRLAGVLRWQLAHPGGADSDDAPDVPIAGQRVWSLFLSLHAARGGNGFGANPLSNTEIEAYARMAREPIRPFEFEIIRALDRVYLEASRDQGKPDVSPVAKEPATADAIFGAFRTAAAPTG